jgi:LPS-assembly protein
MTSRTRLLTTALVVCHLLVVLPVVTSQLRAEGNTPEAPGEQVIIQARQQEKSGSVYHLRGEVVIRFRNLVLRGDEVTYDSASGEITAQGHLVVDGGPHDEHIEASHATYNVRRDAGKFYDVKGTTGARFGGRHVLLTSSNPFAFTGQMVEKVGRDKYIIHHGTITSCAADKPQWTFNVERAVVDVGDQAHLYHSSFRLEGVPIFYFPYVQHPVEKLGRQSGFLIPSLGQSSRKGTIIGEGIYWAINRSMDATLAAEYFSHRGWSQHGEFRARPSDRSFINASYFGVLDRGTGTPKVDQGGQDVRLNAEAPLPGGFRGVADLNYLSSFVFRLAFAETFTLAVNSEVRSNAFLSKSYKGFFFNGSAARYQNFQSTQHGDLITIVHAPGLDLGSVDRRLGKTPFFWSYDASIQGVSRREPNFVTDELVGRFDVQPRISLPLVGHGWSVRPELAVRDTSYTQRLLPGSGVGVPGNDPINRRALEASVEIRPPALGRIFERKVLGHTIKHVIEPRVIYRYVTGVDNFARIIRFDDTDILSDTNELEYGVVNRIYAKPVNAEGNCNPPPEEDELQPAPDRVAPGLPARAGAAPPPAQPTSDCRGAREVISWEIAQKYFFDPSFGGALINGQRNVFTTTADFTGIAFLTEPRRFAPVISRLKVKTARNTDVEWKLDYDTHNGRISASTALVNHRMGEFFVAGSHAYLRTPGEVLVSTPVAAPAEFNQFRWLVGYGHPNKRGLSAATNIGFDVGLRFLQYSAFQTSYNWDCMGISFEYRRFALGSVRNENQFRFALTLSNVGTFGTLRRQERLF